MSRSGTTIADDNPDTVEYARMDYAWKWFEYHAKQRQQNIQFSISVLTATIGAVGYLIVQDSPFVSFFASAFGMFACLIFFGLDARNAFLVKIAEKELARFEESHSEKYETLEVLRAADEPKRFMIKYRLAAALLYSSYALLFFISSLVSVYFLVRP